METGVDVKVTLTVCCLLRSRASVVMIVVSELYKRAEQNTKYCNSLGLV